jgi:hypothetical protein
MPFLAIAGAHGMPLSLANKKNGIGISLKRMKTLEILADGCTARLGPGLLIGEVIKGLDAHGKWAGGRLRCASS